MTVQRVTDQYPTTGGDRGYPDTPLGIGRHGRRGARRPGSASSKPQGPAGGPMEEEVATTGAGRPRAPERVRSRDRGARRAEVRRGGGVGQVQVAEGRRGHGADVVPAGEGVVVLLDGHGAVGHCRDPRHVPDTTLVSLRDRPDGRDVVDEVPQRGGGVVPVVGIAPMHAEVVLEVAHAVGHPHSPGNEARAVAQREAPGVAVAAVVEPDVLGTHPRRRRRVVLGGGSPWPVWTARRVPWRARVAGRPRTHGSSGPAGPTGRG